MLNRILSSICNSRSYLQQRKDVKNWKSFKLANMWWHKLSWNAKIILSSSWLSRGCHLANLPRQPFLKTFFVWSKPRSNAEQGFSCSRVFCHAKKTWKKIGGSKFPRRRFRESVISTRQPFTSPCLDLFLTLAPESKMVSLLCGLIIFFILWRGTYYPSSLGLKKTENESI